MAARDLAPKPHPMKPASRPDQPQNGKAIPVWETLLQIAAEIPDEESAKLPHDAAEQLDHYLYGSPKRKVPRATVRG